MKNIFTICLLLSSVNLFAQGTRVTGQGNTSVIQVYTPMMSSNQIVTLITNIIATTGGGGNATNVTARAGAGININTNGSSDWTFSTPAITNTDSRTVAMNGPWFFQSGLQANDKFYYPGLSDNSILFIKPSTKEVQGTTNNGTGLQVLADTVPPSFKPLSFFNILGTNNFPFRTVSSKGIVLGTSTVTNDGLMFGPDTPGTLTSGIQEAIDSLPKALVLGTGPGGGNVFLSPGIFMTYTNIHAITDRTAFALNMFGQGQFASGITYMGTSNMDVMTIGMREGYDQGTFELHDMWMASSIDSTNAILKINSYSTNGSFTTFGAIGHGNIYDCMFMYWGAYGGVTGGTINFGVLFGGTDFSKHNLIPIDIDANFNNNITVYRCHFISVNGVHWKSDHGSFFENSFVFCGAVNGRNGWPTNDIRSSGACVFIDEGPAGTLDNGNEPWYFGRNSYQTVNLVYCVNAKLNNRAIISSDDNVEASGAAWIATTGRPCVIIDPTSTSIDNLFTNNYIITNTSDFTAWNLFRDTNLVKVIDHRGGRFYNANLKLDGDITATNANFSRLTTVSNMVVNGAKTTTTVVNLGLDANNNVVTNVSAIGGGGGGSSGTVTNAQGPAGVTWTGVGTGLLTASTPSEIVTNNFSAALTVSNTFTIKGGTGLNVGAGVVPGNVLLLDGTFSLDNGQLTGGASSINIISNGVTTADTFLNDGSVYLGGSVTSGKFVMDSTGAVTITNTLTVNKTVTLNGTGSAATVVNLGLDSANHIVTNASPIGGGGGGGWTGNSSQFNSSGGVTNLIAGGTFSNWNAHSSIPFNGTTPVFTIWRTNGTQNNLLVLTNESGGSLNTYFDYTGAEFVPTVTLTNPTVASSATAFVSASNSTLNNLTVTGGLLSTDGRTNAFQVNTATAAPSFNVGTNGVTYVSNLVAYGAVTLTDAATVATDASLGNTFKVTLGGNRTLGNPTNAKDGQRLTWEVIQDGTGSRTLAMDTKFAFGTDITGITLTTTLNKRDFITAIYDSTADKFYVTGFVRGY